MVRLFGQGTGHAHVLFGFLLCLAAAGQQQQQQQQRGQGAGTDHHQQGRIVGGLVGSGVVGRIVDGVQRLALRRYRRTGGSVGVDLFGGTRHGRCRNQLGVGCRSGVTGGRRAAIGCGRQRLGRDQGFGRHRHIGASRLHLGQLVVLELDQLLQLVELALQVGVAAAQLFVVTPGGIQRFLGHGKLLVQCLGIACRTIGLAGARHQAEVVLRRRSGRGRCAIAAPRGVDLLGTRAQPTAFAPRSILPRDFGHCRPRRGGRGLLHVRHAQDLPGLETVDVAVQERIGVERLDGQHGLLDRTALAIARSDFPQRIARAGCVGRLVDGGRRRTHGGSRSVLRGLRGLRGKLRRIEQHAVVAQQTTAGEVDLNQELHQRRGQGLGRGHADDAAAIGVDHRREAQAVQKRLALDARLAELLGRGQHGLDLGGAQAAHVEQFYLGQQRLVHRRPEGQFPQLQGVGDTGGQRRSGSHC